MPSKYCALLNIHFGLGACLTIVFPCRVFGWTPQNEINNGRWVMFGFGVGLLTEYATGVDFIDQIKLMVTYLGIADLD